MRSALLAIVFYFAAAFACFTSHHAAIFHGQGMALAEPAPEPRDEARVADTPAEPQKTESATPVAGETPASPEKAAPEKAAVAPHQTTAAAEKPEPVAEEAVPLPAAKPTQPAVRAVRAQRKATPAEMCDTLAAAAQQQKLPVGFFVRLIQQESAFDPEAVSPVGAQGVAQFMPEVAQEWGLQNPFDPFQALGAAARFLRALYDQFGNWGLAAAAYNGGMGRVQKWLVQKKGKLPEETQKYVLTITGVPVEKWKGGLRKADFTIPAHAPCQKLAYLAYAGADETPLPQPRPRKLATADAKGGKAKSRKQKSVDVAEAAAKADKRKARSRVAAGKSNAKAAKEAKKSDKKGDA